ncbi:MAG: hypothetical protein K6G50_12460 [bacterium]|nr:hypothetical protein [bacterium]
MTPTELFGRCIIKNFCKAGYYLAELLQNLPKMRDNNQEQADKVLQAKWRAGSFYLK